ncbi:hypothetical protein MNBD_GAMMA06-1887 [hydrothermal vent metagenome]|uniref:Uncharacterized protein n=1 Tax=hydrothermal vent metagenome TaxID=652676 RepID=A0A3B0X3Q6_9ZZZZ
MKKCNCISFVPGIFFSLVISVFCQQALADSIITSDNSYEEGDYYIVANNGDSISDFSPSGVLFDGYSFPVRYDAFGQPIINSTFGSGGGFIEANIYNDDHSFLGSGDAGAEVLDPLNELSLIQIDGDAVVDFSFSITTPHTYTLTGNTSVNDFGSVSIFFDSIFLSETDTSFSLSGTLAAGNYSFLAEAMAILDSPGNASANYDFDLQLYEIAAVPVPAAAWLFASGLIGLIGISRHKSIKR